MCVNTCTCIPVYTCRMYIYLNACTFTNVRTNVQPLFVWLTYKGTCLLQSFAITPTLHVYLHVHLYSSNMWLILWVCST